MGRILGNAAVLSGVLTLASCERGPGTLAGELATEPFEVRTARLTGEQHKLTFEVQDQLTQCDTRLKSGRAVRLVLQSDAEIPTPGLYALADAGLPGAWVQLIATDELCRERFVRQAIDAHVELVDVTVEPTRNLFEADLRLRLKFPGNEEVQGSVHGTACPVSRGAFCDANSP